MYWSRCRKRRANERTGARNSVLAMDLVCGGAARNDRHRLGYSQFSAVRLASFGGVPGPIQDGRIYIEKINGPFLFGDMGTPAEYSGLELAISHGCWS